ncbi:MAG: transglycosylase SLT domain-containing protein [Mariprofundus sp.]
MKVNTAFKALKHAMMTALLASLVACANQPFTTTSSVKPVLNVPNLLDGKTQPRQYAGSNPLYSGLPLADIARVQAEVKRHVLPHWPRIAERSSLVRQRVLASINKLDAPAALQAVPVLESGYNPYALSYAGAMGLWQIMPRTAHGLGIRNHQGINGRRDIESSTTAAVEYLTRLHQRFGNWPLALAAYNYGPSALARRLKKDPWQPQDGLNAIPAPQMTRAYVRHVIGFAVLLDMNTVSFPEPVATQPIQLAPPVDLKQLASLSGINEYELFGLNPELDHAQYLNHTVTIHVPANMAEAIMMQVEATAPKYIYVAIHQGDSLWSLARKHRTSVKHLHSLNPDLGKILSIGKTIKVPANQLARAKPTLNPLLNQGRRIRYKVRSGDSLWAIAQRFGTTSSAIARSNQMSHNQLIRPGDTLWILARIRPS